MQKSEQKSAKPKPKKYANYHEAAFSAFGYRLREYVKNGDISLEDEHPLSKRPPKIDIIVLKKDKDVDIETSWGKIFRKHNIIEYKSPIESKLSLSVFYKVVFGYVGLYASQENVKFTDMSVTIVCFNKPETLFETLKTEFDYKVLRKSKGIYYISPKGINTSKSLAIQFIVSSELSDVDLVLKALKSKIDEATARKVLELPVEDEEYSVSLLPWWEVMFLENGSILSKEADMDKWEKLVNDMKKNGFKGRYEQQWEQRGELRGEKRATHQIITFLKSGHSLEEAEKKFAYA